MRGIVRIFIAFVLAVASTGASDALQALRTRVEGAIRTEAPEWQLTRSNLEGSQFDLNLSHGLERLHVRCVEFDSLPAATRELDGVALEAAGGGAVGGIGDAARIWPGCAGDGTTNIYFRRSTFLCNVWAPSVTLSKRLAGFVVREIDALPAATKAPREKAPAETKAGLRARTGGADDYRVTIALVGMDPFSIEVPVGARVTFINKDSRFAHDLASDCPEIDSMGRLEPGESGRTAEFARSKTCHYSDRLYPNSPLRRGTIVVR
jgi:plastocyanin